MPNTHRRRDATVELSRVGVGGVYWALAGYNPSVYIACLVMSCSVDCTAFKTTSVKTSS